MPTLRAVEKRAAERLVMARNILEQRDSMERMNLNEVEYLLFRLGCSINEAEKLAAKVKAEKDGHDTVKDVAGSGYERWSCRSCSATCLRSPYMSDAEWNAKLHAWRAAHPAKAMP